MRTIIDKNKCTGCGICKNICPEGIEIVNGKARIKNQDMACLKNAVNTCPQGAIIVEGTNEKTEPNTGFNQEYGQGMDKGQSRGMGQGRGKGLGTGPRDGRGKGRGGGGRRKW